VLVFLSAFVISCGVVQISWEAEVRQALIGGVEEIAAPGIPGPLCVFGDKAVAVIVGKSETEFMSQS